MLPWLKRFLRPGAPLNRARTSTASRSDSMNAASTPADKPASQRTPGAIHRKMPYSANLTTIQLKPAAPAQVRPACSSP
jgi:hypothetical protein